MRLLVTRPEPDAARTAARLRAAGHEVLVQPLLAIRLLSPPVAMERPAAIVVTSQNGLRALAAWPVADAWRGLPLFAAGPATGRAAGALGFTDVRTGAGDAASLAAFVAGALAKGAGPLLYPATRDRAGDIDRDLTDRGYDVRVVEAYRADAVAELDAGVRQAIAGGGLDGVLLYSRRTAEAFLALARGAGLGGRIGGLAYFVISPQVGDVVAATGGRVQVALRPDEDAVLELVAGG